MIEAESGNTYLIDCGSLDVSNVGTYRLQPFLKHEGICELEAVFLSHADHDHVSGVEELLMELSENRNGSKTKINSLVLPKNAEGFEKIIGLAEQAEIPIRFFTEGDSLIDGKLQLQCVFPDIGQITLDRNETSMILHMKQDWFDCLLMADTGEVGEKATIKYLENQGTERMKTEVIKVAHHGSRNSNSDLFLQKIEPQIAVISCGKENRYGHPHEEVLQRLADCESDTYITAVYGAVQMKVIKETILIMKNPYFEKIF